MKILLIIFVSFAILLAGASWVAASSTSVDHIRITVYYTLAAGDPPAAVKMYATSIVVYPGGGLKITP